MQEVARLLLLCAAGDAVRGQGWILGNNSRSFGRFMQHRRVLQPGRFYTKNTATLRETHWDRDRDTHPHKLYI